MNNKEYLSRELLANRNTWLNADSDEDEDASDLRYSGSFIIQMVNAASAGTPSPNVANVDIGDSYTNRAASNFGQSAHITITSTVQGVSYLEFLAQSEAQPFIVGRTMIISTSAGQLDQSVAITHRNASGDRQDHVITPTLDPYQAQTDRIIDDTEYMFDGMSRLRFNQINANATVTVKMYLRHKWSATNIVANKNQEVNYAAPHIIKVAPRII